MTCTNPACPVITTLPGLCQGCRETRRRLLAGKCVWCGRPSVQARCPDCLLESAVWQATLSAATSYLIGRYGADRA